MSSGFDASKFFDLFVQEAGEQIETLDQAVVGLDDQSTAADLIEQIFRAAHSLKAAAASQGLDEMSRISHALENVFDRIRNRELGPDAELVDLLLAGVDALKAHLHSAVMRQPAPSCSELLARLQASTCEPVDQSATQPVRPPAISYDADWPEDMPLTGTRLCIALAEGCAMPAARAWLVLQQLAGHGDILYATPSLDDLGSGESEVERVYVAMEAQLDDEELLQIASAMPDVAHVAVGKPNPDTCGDVGSPQATECSGNVATAATAAGPSESPKTPLTRATVRVSVENMDALMNLVGELVISRTRLLNLTRNLEDLSVAHRLTEDRDGDLGKVSKSFRQVIGNLKTVVSELQERVMQSRMVPVSQVFGRFPRLVRDVARREGKRVELVVEGADTELDRSVIEDIVDPLTHLLRNAVGHGIEPPAIRRTAGKPETGTVRLSARRHQSTVVIEVSDDGAGIDADALRRKAVEKGLMTQQEAALTPDRQILEVIFAPGFSTATSVSDVSGRGVGMDVVKSNMDKLGGHVEIESIVGKGTTISLRLPLTLAIIPGLLVGAGGVLFALPLASVLRILRITASELHHVGGAPVIVVGDATLPLVSLAEASGFRKSARQTTDKSIAVMLTDGRETLGVTVDDIVGNEELVLQPLGELLQDVRMVNGAAILGDGRLALVVDPNSLIRTASERQTARGMMTG